MKLGNFLTGPVITVMLCYTILLSSLMVDMDTSEIFLASDIHDTIVVTLDTDLSWDLRHVNTSQWAVISGDNPCYYHVTGVTLMTLMMSTNTSQPCHTSYCCYVCVLYL